MVLMKISEAKAGQNASVEGEIVELEAPREVTSKFGKRLRVASGVLRDDSGDITLSLWNEDADKFAQGDKVSITDGWISDYKGKLQISMGRNGKIAKI
jgi:ssDNA-binding replication factor A large subunit